jgi:hypothetical protein
VLAGAAAGGVPVTAAWTALVVAGVAGVGFVCGWAVRALWGTAKPAQYVVPGMVYQLPDGTPVLVDYASTTNVRYRLVVPVDDANRHAVFDLDARTALVVLRPHYQAVANQELDRVRPT